MHSPSFALPMAGMDRPAAGRGRFALALLATTLYFASLTRGANELLRRAVLARTRTSPHTASGRGK